MLTPLLFLKKVADFITIHGEAASTLALPLSTIHLFYLPLLPVELDLGVDVLKVHSRPFLPASDSLEVNGGLHTCAMKTFVGGQVR